MPSTQARLVKLSFFSTMHDVRLAGFAALAFSALAGVAGAGTLGKVWDFNISAVLGAETGSQVGVFAIGFSRDGKQVAAVIGHSWREESVLILDTEAPSSRRRAFPVNPMVWDWEPGLNRRIDWSPSGLQIILGNLVMNVVSGKTCSLPTINLSPGYRFVGSQVVGAQFQPPRFTSFDTDCRLNDTWEIGGATELKISDASSTSDLILVTRTTISGGGSVELSSLTTKSVVRQLPPTSAITKFADNSSAICGATGKPWHHAIECWATKDGGVIAKSDGWKSPDVRAASASPRVVISDYSRKLDWFVDWFWYPGALSKRVIWDYRSGKQLVTWKPRNQKIQTGEFPNAVVRQEQPYRFDISPKGDYIVEGGSGTIALYNIGP
jgi:hypothetical protein